jgi:hypothetical protein
MRAVRLRSLARVDPAQAGQARAKPRPPRPGSVGTSAQVLPALVLDSRSLRC